MKNLRTRRERKRIRAEMTERYRERERETERCVELGSLGARGNCGLYAFRWERIDVKGKNAILTELTGKGPRLNPSSVIFVDGRIRQKGEPVEG